MTKEYAELVEDNQELKQIIFALLKACKGALLCISVALENKNTKGLSLELALKDLQQVIAKTEGKLTNNQ